MRKNIQVTPLTKNIYRAHLARELCVGEVPNGGYVGSVLLAAAADYLAPRGQPDTLQVHFQFLGRTAAGPAYVRVQDVKLGRNTSVVHVSLHQGDMLDSAPWIDATASTNGEVFAYVTNMDLGAEKGISLPTEWTLSYPPPRPDLHALKSGRAQGWKKYYLPLMERVQSLHMLEYYVPAGGFANRATQDYWIRCANGETFSNLMLGFVADCAAPLVIEAYRQTSEDAPPRQDEVPMRQGFWYPTLTMSIDVKKKLPDQGAEWLQLRAASKQIKNGRSDSEIVVFDESGDLVMLSNHVALAVDFRMNARGRSKPQGKI